MTAIFTRMKVLFSFQNCFNDHKQVPIILFSGNDLEPESIIDSEV